MASFTDTQMPKFNPYIQQQPVEAMVSVGMQKQKAYEEGVQKIQAQVDSIAGLDIGNDVGRAYLQSKLNELGNKLRTVAAGDFSNFQLVNSVGGMTKQLIRDEGIQNAVASTARYRKEQAHLDKDIADGKENPANTVHFKKHASEWFNATDVKQPFTAKYYTPKDVWGKIKDIAKEVGIDEQTVPNLYQTDTNGNYILDASGKPIWNKVMVEKTLKGKDAGKILKAFETGLSPEDYQQLNINGEYQNAGLDGPALKQRISEDAAKQTAFNEEKLQKLQVALYTENQKNVKDPDKIASISTQIEYFENNLEKLKTSTEANMKRADTNPDAVRASLYTNDYLYSMSRGLSSQDVSTKYSVSPLFEITMKENEFNRQIQRDKISDYHWSVEQQNSMLKAAGEREDKALEMYLKYGVKLPGLKVPPGMGPERLPEGIPETKKDAQKIAVEDEYSTSVEKLNSNNYDLTLNYFKEINKQRPNESAEAYETRMKKAIDYYARGNKEQAADLRTGDINSFTARFAGKQLQNWKVNPKSVPAEFRGTIASQNKLTQDLSILREKMTKVKKEAQAIAVEQGLDSVTDEEIKKNIKETTVVVGRDGGSPLAGRTFHLPKQDVVDFANLHPEVYNVFGGWSIDKQQEQRRDLSRKRLELKYGRDFKALDNYLYDARTVKSEMGGTTSVYGNVNPTIVAAGKFMNGSDYARVSKIESDLYIKYGVVKQPFSVTLYRGEEKPEDFSSRVSSVVDKYNHDGSILASSGLTNEELQDALLTTDKKAVKVVSYPGIGTGDVTNVMRITTPKGKTLELNIDRDDYRILTRSDSPENIPIPKVADKLNMSSTTNHTGGSDPSGAWWGQDDFINLDSKKYTVTADLINDKESKNTAWLKLYIHDKKDPDKVETITFPNPINKYNIDGSYNTTLDYLPAGITNSVLEQIRKQ